MKLESGIRNPSQLKEVIEVAKRHGEDYLDAIYAIHKYKWYNWYQNLHIKEGTDADIENSLIFEELKNNFPDIHSDVELNIDSEIQRLKD